MLNLGKEQKGNWINGSRLHDAISTNHRPQHLTSITSSDITVLHTVLQVPSSTPRNTYTRQTRMLKLRKTHTYTHTQSVCKDIDFKWTTRRKSQSGGIQRLCYSFISISACWFLYCKQCSRFNNWFLSISATGHRDKKNITLRKTQR